MVALLQDHAVDASSSLDGSALTWSYPSACLLVPPIVLTLQSTLPFIQPSSRLYSLSSSAIFRLSILPLSLYAIWHSCSLPERSFFHPTKDFIHLNTVIQLSKFWACMRSVEFAVSDVKEYKWIGYEKAYSSQDISDTTDDGKPSNRETGMTHSSENIPDKRENGKPETSEEISDQYVNEKLTDSRNPILLGWLNLCSLRGIGWQWGIKGTSIPSPHSSDHFILSLLFRVIWSHILTILAVSFVVYHRQHSSLHEQVLRTYFHNLPHDSAIIDTASRLIQVSVFGLVIYTTLECGYSLLTLSVYLLTSLSRALVPSHSPVLANLKPDKFNIKAWPRLSNKPIFSISLTDFWGKRWHSLFRRIFISVGAKPLSSLPEKAGFRKVNKGVKIALGTIGAFMTSGVLHECFNDATPWLPRDPHYTVFIFFTLQALGMIFEKAIMTLLLGGSKSKASKIFGRIWCWSFLLFTGLLMTECWVDRGIVDNQPPIEEWKWWRWYLPLAFVIPDLTSRRLHQLKHA